ncbi:MAG: polysaccharide pyruvyl transferase family protein [Anaerovibrio sp.]
MKIGIVTLSASDNCGSLLQAYALKHYCSSLTDYVDVVNFTSLKSKNQYAIFPDGWWKHPRLCFAILKNIRKLIRQKKSYKRFREVYVTGGSNEVYIEDLEKISLEYDIMIVGSDQVWNVRMYDFSLGFFLPKVLCRKIAYAVSLGGYKVSEYENFEDVKCYIEQFDAVSTREEYGKFDLEKILSIDIPVLSDPTFLLSIEEWQKVAGEKQFFSGEYIFYYSWSYGDDRLNQLVYEEGRRTGMPVVVIDCSKWVWKKNIYNFVILDNGGPKIFLNLMRYCRKAFVESFHGLIFAYILKKDFWILNEKNRVEDVRLSELIELLECSNRVLYPGKKITECLDNKEFMYGESLKKRIENSKKFLSEVIGK